MSFTLSRASAALTLLTTLSLAFSPIASAQTVKFRRPIDTVKSPAISAHYDHDGGSGLQTYTCGTSTYNGHKGTDFRADVGWPVRAGAKGGLYRRHDGCPTYGSGDFNSTQAQCGNYFGNQAWIDHEGSTTDGVGWVTIYAHMKQGTVVGYSSVNCSSKIGEAGSSGYSTGPHVHFEVRKYSFPNNDPFSGPCSGSTSFWVNQNGGLPTTQCQA